MTRGVAVIMAAGLGTRMRSGTAKVLHPLLGRPMVGHVVDTAKAAGFAPVVVVHHQAEAVRAALEGTGARTALQQTPLGTGDAVRSAVGEIPDEGVVIVLSGDVPLVRPLTLSRLWEAHTQAGPGRVATVLTVTLNEPEQYGRVVRGKDGRVRIVEAAHATQDELAIREINTGTYAFDAAWLKTALAELKPHEPKGEFYLTDVVERASQDGGAGAVAHEDAEELLGINDRWALSRAERALRMRVLMAHALAGVTFEDPESTRVELGVTLEPDCTIGAGVHLLGATHIGAGARIGAYSILADTVVEPGAWVEGHTNARAARIGAGARVGPFARLRENAVVGPQAQIGNFVEVKNTTVGARTKAHHLAYLGDGTIGDDANIGAGTIFCNYDGFQKHRTEVGRGAFIGSNAVLVAPVSIGEGAVVGAGSVIVSPVPADAIAVARAPQTVSEGAAKRRRAKRSRP